MQSVELFTELKRYMHQFSVLYSVCLQDGFSPSYHETQDSSLPFQELSLLTEVQEIFLCDSLTHLDIWVWTTPGQMLGTELIFLTGAEQRGGFNPVKALILCYCLKSKCSSVGVIFNSEYWWPHLLGIVESYIYILTSQDQYGMESVVADLSNKNSFTKTKKKKSFKISKASTPNSFPTCYITWEKLSDVTNFIRKE